MSANTVTSLPPPSVTELNLSEQQKDVYKLINDSIQHLETKVAASTQGEGIEAIGVSLLSKNSTP